MRPWLRVIGVAAVVGILVGVLLSVSAPVPEFGPLDAIHNRSQFRDGSEMRVPGTVIGPVETDESGTSFELGGDEVSFAVEFPQRPPDGLLDGATVIVQGTWIESVFHASSIDVTTS